LEGSFAESVLLASRLRDLSDEQLKILERVDEACKELYLSEFEHYIAHKREYPHRLQIREAWCDILRVEEEIVHSLSGR